MYPSLTSFFLGNHKVVFYVCESVSILCIYLFVLFLDSTYKRYHIIFVFIWLISLSIMFFRSIHVAANAKLHSFSQLSNSPLYLHTSKTICLSEGAGVVSMSCLL